MSFQDADSQVINEHEINDLMNTVIDWGDSEGATGEDVLGLGAVIVKMRTTPRIFPFGWVEHRRHHHV
uniref:Uncharacterized protein n=1 Tax=Knipowitschia caucasica TaxID=637954 RepID=A0AAV2LJD0_KNICA